METENTNPEINYDVLYRYRYRKDDPNAIVTFHGRPIKDFTQPESSGLFIKNIRLLEGRKYDSWILIKGARDEWSKSFGSTHTLVNPDAAYEMYKLGTQPDEYVGGIHPYGKHLSVKFVGRNMYYINADEQWEKLAYITVK